MPLRSAQTWAVSVPTPWPSQSASVADAPSRGSHVSTTAPAWQVACPEFPAHTPTPQLVVTVMNSSSTDPSQSLSSPSHIESLGEAPPNGLHESTITPEPQLVTPAGADTADHLIDDTDHRALVGNTALDTLRRTSFSFSLVDIHCHRPAGSPFRSPTLRGRSVDPGDI